MNHVRWSGCQCSVVHGGEGAESSSYTAVDSKELGHLRAIIQDKEEALKTMEEAAARAISEARAFAVDLCAAQRDCAALRQEVDVARAHVVALARGAARIGHFSMRVGGG
jgi:hypothetical protein